jgi:hypothetical protein
VWPCLPIDFGDLMSYIQITDFKVPRNERLFAVFPKTRIKTPSASKLTKVTGIRMMNFWFSFRKPTTLTDVLVVFRVRPGKCRLEPTHFQITSIYYLLIALSFNARIYRFIRNDCRGFNNLSYTIHLR